MWISEWFTLKYRASRIINSLWYPDCDTNNITTDEIYKWFFMSLLLKEKWESELQDAIIDMFIYEIEHPEDMN